MHRMRSLLICLLIAGPVLAHGDRLPLGDGRISAEPRAGHVMACRTSFPGGGGAHRAGPWIGQGTWDPGARPVVEGEVTWSNAFVSVSVEGAHRVIRGNALPRHATGVFPISPGSEAYRYDRNPNAIRAADVLLRIPARPAPAARPGCVPMGMIGIAISGVAIFNAFDLAGRDAPAWEIQDRCNGHPERDGRYHYHDFSPCLGALATEGADQPLGWMLDGFPILGPRFADGRQVTNSDLDECHGQVGEVVLNGARTRMYHYRFTRQFPYTLGCFRGAVDPALLRR